MNQAAISQESLSRAISGQSVMNYTAILEGFAARGIPLDEIRPRENVFSLHGGHFNGDLARMLAFLIDEHPAGWYSINGADFTVDAGAAEGPECYCHGTRSEEPNPVTESSDAGMEWAYVFDEPARILYVFERLHDPDAGPGRELFSGKPIADMSFHHMTGMFGMGAPDAQHWAIAAKVELDGTEPDWEHVSAAEYMASAIAA